MTNLILQPSASAASRRHYRDTVSNFVKVGDVKSSCLQLSESALKKAIRVVNSDVGVSLQLRRLKGNGTGLIEAMWVFSPGQGKSIRKLP